MLNIIVLSAILTSTINLTAEAKKNDKSCELHYNIKKIGGPYGYIYDFEIDHSKSDLYFTDANKWEMIRFNIQTGLSEILPIPSKTDFKAAVDDRQGIVYIPTVTGIYTYNTTTNKTGELLPNTEKINVVYLQLKDNKLYYTVPSRYDVFTHNYTLFEYDLVNREPAKKVEAFQNFNLTKFVIDDDGDITFANFSGMYTWKKQINRFDRYNRITAWFSCLFYDRYNSILYTHKGYGIYIVDKNAMKLKKVLDAPAGLGLAIDQYNNTIYSDYNYIYKAIPTKYCKCKLA